MQFGACLSTRCSVLELGREGAVISHRQRPPGSFPRAAGSALLQPQGRVTCVPLALRAGGSGDKLLQDEERGAAGSLSRQRVSIPCTLTLLYKEKQWDSKCRKQLQQLCASTRLLFANWIPRWPLAPSYLTCILSKASGSRVCTTARSLWICSHTMFTSALPAGLFTSGANLTIFSP